MQGKLSAWHNSKCSINSILLSGSNSVMKACEWRWQGEGHAPNSPVNSIYYWK